MPCKKSRNNRSQLPSMSTSWTRKLRVCCKIWSKWGTVLCITYYIFHSSQGVINTPWDHEHHLFACNKSLANWMVISQCRPILYFNNRNIYLLPSTLSCTTPDPQIFLQVGKWTMSTSLQFLTKLPHVLEIYFLWLISFLRTCLVIIITISSSSPLTEQLMEILSSPIM